jgi:hypothetical protein
MVDEKADVVMFRIPLCGKCKQVVANLAQVKKDRPSLNVQIYTLPDHISEANKHGLLTVPALLIKGKPYKGVLSTQEILAALNTPIPSA